MQSIIQSTISLVSGMHVHGVFGEVMDKKSRIDC